MFWDCHYAVPENIHTPPAEVIGISWGGWGGSVRGIHLKKLMMLNWYFQWFGELKVTSAYEPRLIKPELILFSVA